MQRNFLLVAVTLRANPAALTVTVMDKCASSMQTWRASAFASPHNSRSASLVNVKMWTSVVWIALG